MILKVSSASTSLAKSTNQPGPTDGGHYVRIKHVPKGVSVGQVIVLFVNTAKKEAEKERRYVFAFSELCPSVSLFKR